MSVEIIENEYHKVIFCNTTMVSFGPVFNQKEDIEEFLKWLPMDARVYDKKELYSKYYEWLELRDLANIKNIDQSTIEIEDIFTSDYPNFNDAFISAANFNDGTALNDEQLEEFIHKWDYLVTEMILENQLYL